MRIGILTAGGDCPGINATIRSVCKTAVNHYNMDVVGIRDGFSGLVNDKMIFMDDKAFSGLITIGGTVLGTSREKPFKKTGEPGQADKPARMLENIEKHKLDAIVCIGGGGTLKTARKLGDLGVNVVSIPKTIDNDIYGTDFCFGFDTAVTIATDAIDRLHSTATSHRRVMVVEVMGHKAGWIALYAGMAGGSDAIILPEMDYDIHNISSKVIDRLKKGKPYSIVVVGEGVKVPKGFSPARYFTERIQNETGFETRETVLGYIQRGGSPTAFDRNLATRMGGHASDMIARGEFGRMVALRGSEMTSLPLEEVAGRLRLVEPDNDLIRQGRHMGICFG